MELAILKFVEGLFKAGYIRIGLAVILVAVAVWSLGRAGLFLGTFLRDFLDIQKQEKASIMNSLNSQIEHGKNNEDKLINLLDRNTKAIEILSSNMVEQTSLLNEIKRNNDDSHLEISKHLENIRGWMGRS